MSYVVVAKSANMPGSCWGKYARVAVVEVVDTAKPVKMISDRDTNVRQVVKTWERLNIGRPNWGTFRAGPRQGSRDAFARAWREAEKLVEEMISSHVWVTYDVWNGSKIEGGK